MIYALAGTHKSNMAAGAVTKVPSHAGVKHPPRSISCMAASLTEPAVIFTVGSDVSTGMPSVLHESLIFAEAIN